MAKPTVARLEYIGCIEVKVGQTYLASDFNTLFPNATTFIMKSKGKIVNGIREAIEVGIENTPMFPVSFDEATAFDPTRTPSLKYKFSQNCIIVVAKDLDVL